MRSRSLCAPARSASARATWARASRTSSTRDPARRSRSSASASARSARAASRARRVSVVSIRASSWPAATVVPSSTARLSMVPATLVDTRTSVAST